MSSWFVLCRRPRRGRRSPGRVQVAPRRCNEVRHGRERVAAPTHTSYRNTERAGTEIHIEIVTAAIYVAGGVQKATGTQPAQVPPSIPVIRFTYGDLGALTPPVARYMCVRPRRPTQTQTWRQRHTLNGGTVLVSECRHEFANVVVTF